MGRWGGERQHALDADTLTQRRCNRDTTQGNSVIVQSKSRGDRAGFAREEAPCLKFAACL
jgi:hypothetical protein